MRTMLRYPFGWAGPENAEREFARLHEHFVPFFIAGQTRSTSGQRVVLWEAARELQGRQDLENVPQEIGDCVGESAADAVDYLAAWEIGRLGQREKFRRAFSSYIYGISRVQIGGGRLGVSDGSLGSWAAEALRRFGVLPVDAPGVPKYSGRVAREWGLKGPPEPFFQRAKNHLVRSVARVHSYEQLREALVNGYPAIYASMMGHQMQLAYDRGKGWHQGYDTWPHQRSVIGVDDDPTRPGAYFLNQWGPHAHGPQPDGPPGGGWIDAEAIDRDLRKSGTECFVLSMFDGFPETRPDHVLL